ncbi:MAG TPA: response regulator [Pyrinomonadaceae bacterium]|jgi:CheY-like chemotaxis protein
MNERSDNGHTVLLVDDNEDVRSLMSFWLEERGYRVVQASNGDMGVEAAIRERPNVILMDICMPHLNGFTAARRILAQEQLRDVPIIAISAHDIDELHGAAIDAGCVELLGKPVDSDRLENVLSRLLPDNVDVSGA